MGEWGHRPKPSDPPVVATLREVLQDTGAYSAAAATCVFNLSAHCQANITRRVGRGTWTRDRGDKSLAIAGSNLRCPQFKPPPQPIRASMRSKALKSLTASLDLGAQRWDAWELRGVETTPS